MDFVIWNKKQWLPYFFLQACTLYYSGLLKLTHGIARLAVALRKKEEGNTRRYDTTAKTRIEQQSLEITSVGAEQSVQKLKHAVPLGSYYCSPSSQSQFEGSGM